MMRWRVILSSVPFILLSVLFLATNEASANGMWGDDGDGISSVIPENGQGNLNLDPNTIQLGYNKAYTTYTLYADSSTVTKQIKASEMTKNETFVLSSNGSIKVTYAGVYNNKNVDMTIKKTSNKASVANVTITPEGAITASGLRGDGSITPMLKPVQQFTLKLLDHDTNAVLKNAPFILTQSQQNNASQRSVFYGYDKSSTKQLYALGNTTASRTYMYYNKDYGMVNFENVSSAPLSYIFYGVTNSSTGDINLYSGVSISDTSTISYNILNANSEFNIIPLKYSPARTDIEETTSDGGQYVNLTIEQDMLVQKMPQYYPVSGTLTMTITQTFIDYLDITNDDFSIFSGGSEISKDKYKTSVSRLNSSRAIINISFLNQFAEEYAGKTIQVKQKSKIKSDETSIVPALLDDKTVLIGSRVGLKYTMQTGILQNPNVSVTADSVSSYVRIIPELSGTPITTESVSGGTRVSSIPIESLISDLKNIYYTWDTVTATYKNPNQVLNSAGVQPIDIVLTSGTFENQTTVQTSVNVTNSYVLTYNANGGQVNGTASYETTFTSSGVNLLGAENVKRGGYSFLGWSTSKEAATVNFDEGYHYGTVEAEQEDVTLYAVWKKNNEIKVSWDSSDTILDVSKEIDRSLTKYSIPFFWNSNTKGSSYQIVQIFNGESTSLDIITQDTESSDMAESELTIDTSKLGYGENQVKFEFYELDGSDVIIDKDNPSATFTLSLNISGSLQIQSAPESIDWTKRTMRSSKGLLNRDNDNTIELDVIDSRETPTTNWYLQANATILNDNVPFTFVWKSSKEANPVSITDNNVKIMDSESATKKSNYNYIQSWNNDTGVLLESSKYVSSGNYDDVATINWTLYDVARAE